MIYKLKASLVAVTKVSWSDSAFRVKRRCIMMWPITNSCTATSILKYLHGCNWKLYSCGSDNTHKTDFTTCVRQRNKRQQFSFIYVLCITKRYTKPRNYPKHVIKVQKWTAGEHFMYTHQHQGMLLDEQNSGYPNPLTAITPHIKQHNTNATSLCTPATATDQHSTGHTT